MNIQHSILEKYAKISLSHYSPDIKESILRAISPNISEDLLQVKISKTNWRDTNLIKQLCAAKLATLKVLEQPSFEEKTKEVEASIKASLKRQKQKQEEGISQHLIQRVSSITPHTLINLLSKRTAKAEYKFQLSRTPLFDDQETLEHSVIEPYGSLKGEAISTDSYKLIVSYSVFNIDNMPLPLLDMALNGSMKVKYNKMEELELKLQGAHHEERIKEFLLRAKPLKYTPQNTAIMKEKNESKNSDTPNKTQRIMSLSKDNKNVGYMLSENTPFAYEEKSLRQYVNNMIRYSFFNNRNTLIAHLEQELPYGIEKVAKRIISENKFTHYKQLGLSALYQKDEYRTMFFDDITILKKDVEHGQTLVEQRLSTLLNNMHGKNAAQDTVVFNSIVRVLGE
ncbi:hypothetical protein KBC03_06565 [Patescibacteria group bacterium]|nr:hypothetical protein [Patescibacteria group bacterium]